MGLIERIHPINDCGAGRCAGRLRRWPDLVGRSSQVAGAAACDRAPAAGISSSRLEVD
jgi:hypothetical protein